MFGVVSSISRKDCISVSINKMNDSTRGQNRKFKSNLSQKKMLSVVLDRLS